MRIVFSGSASLLEWILSRVFEDRYEAYLTTEDREIILLPMKSTRPIAIAYLKLPKDDDGKSIIDKLKERRISIYSIKTIEWDYEKAVGVKIPVE